MGRQGLLFDATHRKDKAAQGDLTRHGGVGAHVRPAKSEASAMNIATPALGPSFGTAPAGTCT
jgi:hypothetical protein